MIGRKLISYFALTRAYMSGMLGVTAICGAYLAGGRPTWEAAILLFISQGFVAAGCYALNDLLDVRRDMQAAFKPLASGRLSLTEARSAIVALYAIGLTASLVFGNLPCFIAIVQIVVLRFYSRLKLRSGALAVLTTAALCSSAFIFGAATELRLGLVWIPVLLTFEINIAREVVKDVLDIDRDQMADVPTIPRKYGLTGASRLVLLAVLATVVTSLLPAVTHAFSAVYPRLIIPVDVALVVVALLFVVSPRRYAGTFLVASAGVFPFAILAFLL